MNTIDQAIQLIEQNELNEAVSILRDYVRQASDNELITFNKYYSTVTLFARFLGWSTSVPRKTATW